MEILCKIQFEMLGAEPGQASQAVTPSGAARLADLPMADLGPVSGVKLEWASLVVVPSGSAHQADPLWATNFQCRALTG